MASFSVLLAKEWKESLRNGKLLIVSLIFLFFGFSSPLLAKFTPQLIKALGTGESGVSITMPEPVVADAIAQFIKNVGGNGMLIAIIIGIGMVVREKERGTAAFVLTKPVSHAAFLLAKVASIALTLAIGIVLAAIATFWYTSLLFTTIPLGGFIAASALIFLGLFAISTVAFLGSTIMPSTVSSAGFGIAAYIILMILSALPKIGPFIPGLASSQSSALALGNTPVDLWKPLLANGLAIVVFVGLAWILFTRQEQRTSE
jgi:ABC-2 type transport system permease protein